MSKIGNYNLVYKVIEDYHYLANPISASISGGVVFGIPGAIVGLGISVIEETALYGGFIRERYLTVSFTSLTICYTIYPSLIMAAIGALGGVLLSKNFLENYNDEIGYSLIVIGIGTSKFGMSGTLISASLILSEQVLLYYDIIDKHYLSWSMLGVISLDVVLQYPKISYSLGLIIGLIIANYEENINQSFKPVMIAKDLYKLYSKILSKDFIDNHIQEYSVVLLNFQVVMHQLGVKLLKYEQDLMYHFEHTDENIRRPLGNLNMITVNFFLFLVPYTITEILASIISSFYSTTLYLEIDNLLRVRLFANENALILSLNKNNTVLIDNLKLDARTVSYEGSKLMTDSILKLIRGSYGFSILLTHSPDLLIYSILYNKLNEYISNFLASTHNEFEIRIKELETLISSVLKHDMHNIRTITALGGLESSYKQLQNIYDELRENELKGDQILRIMDVWNRFKSITGFIYNYYLVGYKISQGIISFDHRAIVHFSCLEVQSLLSWNGEKSKDIKLLYRSIERLEVYLNNTNINMEDGIKREINVHNDSLILSEIDIIVGENHLLHIERLELEMGKRYVIIAESGSGKTSLILKISGVKGGNIKGQGTIYYPVNKNIRLINQDEYFSLNKKLIEIIFYPGDINYSQVVQIVEPLMRIMGLEHYDLNQTEDWYSVLSGGQKKKIMIISAVVFSPAILLLDEVFNGLDIDSVRIIQQIILEYLPNSLILAIDHNAEQNNNMGFYSDYLKLDGRKLVAFNNQLNVENGFEKSDLTEVLPLGDQCFYFNETET